LGAGGGRGVKQAGVLEIGGRAGGLKAKVGLAAMPRGRTLPGKKRPATVSRMGGKKPGPGIFRQAEGFRGLLSRQAVPRRRGPGQIGGGETQTQVLGFLEWALTLLRLGCGTLKGVGGFRAPCPKNPAGLGCWKRLWGGPIGAVFRPFYAAAAGGCGRNSERGARGPAGAMGGLGGKKKAVIKIFRKAADEGGAGGCFVNGKIEVFQCQRKKNTRGRTGKCYQFACRRKKKKRGNS